MAISSRDIEKIRTKFLEDPDWSIVEDMFTAHLVPLLDMTTIDTTQPAEHVKAEVIGRTKAHNAIVDILNESKIVTRQLVKVKNPYA